MISNKELTHLFFHDLKKYNSTNFRTIKDANLNEDRPTVHKAFSSVVTRYFIFCERHPEISDTDMRILFFKLKIDLIAKYFSEYPDESNIDGLRAFQIELQSYIKETKDSETDTDIDEGEEAAEVGSKLQAAAV